MSRLAKKTVNLPEGVSAVTQDARVLIKGPKGESEVKILSGLQVETREREIAVKTEGGSKQARVNAGTMWSLLKNASEGVSSGFTKILELEGVGFRASMEGKTLVLSLGFVNPVRYSPPEGVSVAVEKNAITVSGPNKELVGQAAAEIRSFKKPEPYKGKGIHYRGEVIRRKAGKKAAGTTA